MEGRGRVRDIVRQGMCVHAVVPRRCLSGGEVGGWVARLQGGRAVVQDYA